MYIHTYIYIYVSMYACGHVSSYVYIYIYVQIAICYICIYKCIITGFCSSISTHMFHGSSYRLKQLHSHELQNQNCTDSMTALFFFVH